MVSTTLIKFRHSVLTSQKSGLLIIPPNNVEVEIPTKGRLIQTTHSLASIRNRFKYQKNKN